MTEYLEKKDFEKFVKNDFGHVAKDVIRIKVNLKWIIWGVGVIVATLITNLIKPFLA